MITKFNSYNESLRDKLKGKTKEEVYKGINNLMEDIASSLHGWGDIKDYDKGLKYIRINFMPEIRKLTIDGWDYDSIKDKLILDVVQDLIDKNIYI